MLSVGRCPWAVVYVSLKTRALVVLALASALARAAVLLARGVVVLPARRVVVLLARRVVVILLARRVVILLARRVVVLLWVVVSLVVVGVGVALLRLQQGVGLGRHGRRAL